MKRTPYLFLSVLIFAGFLVHPGISVRAQEAEEVQEEYMDIAQLSEEDKEIIKNLELIDNLDWLVNMDIDFLENLELFLSNS